MFGLIDVSYYQSAVNDAYPHPVLAIRSNDGTYRDPKFQNPQTGAPGAHWAWAKRALDSGRLQILIVYCVYRQNWQQTADTMIDMVGTPPDPRIVAMIDVESWQGQIQGNQSDGINRLYWRLADWLGDPRRVIGYGNRGDLNALWPNKPEGIRLVVASYGGSPPRYPGMIAHQYGSNIFCAPFGNCDMNAANDFDDAAQLAAVLGIGSAAGRTTHFRERNMLRLAPPTDQDGKPDGRWPAQEESIALVGPAGGWSGRQVVHTLPPWGGMFIQEAWWAPSGRHVVNRYDDKTGQGGQYIDSFVPTCWEAPTGERGFVVRFSTRAPTTFTLETEH